MNDPITLLRKDHREAEALLKKLEESKNPSGQRRTTVEKLTAALTLHMQIEEQLIYPAVREFLGSEPAEEAEIEHGLAREGITKLRTLVDEPGFGAAVDMVKAGIKHHVKEEETEMFPKLKKKLSRDQLAQLGDDVVVMKESAANARAA